MTRSRSRSSSTAPVSLVRTWVIGNGTCADPTFTVTSTSTDESTLMSESEAMIDTVTPNFSKLSGDGIIVNNPLIHETVKEVLTPLGISKTHVHTSVACSPSKTLYWTDNVSGQSDLSALLDADGINYLGPPSLNPDLANQAITSAWAGVDQSELLGLASLSEGAKTISSLAAILTRVIKIMRAARSLRMAELAHEISPKELANRWMEIRYALRPLYYDMQGLSKVYDQYGPKSAMKPARRTSRGVVTDSGSANDYVDVVKENTVHRVTYRYIRTTTLQVEVSAGVLFCIETPSVFAALGGWMIAETAWELIPYSFIIDWFFNAGKTIAAWTPNVGIKALSSWVRTTSVLTQSITVLVNQVTCLKSGTCAGLSYSASGSAVKTTHSINRNPDPYRPVVPSFTLNLDVTKIIDLLIIMSRLK